MKIKLPKIRIPKITLPKVRIPSEVIAILVVLLVMCLPFLPYHEFAPSHKLTSDKFIRLCADAGYTVADDTASHHPSFFAEVISGSDDEFTITYYTFTHNAYSKAFYTQFLNAVQTHERREKYTYTSNYNRFYTSTDTRMIFLYRNNEKMIYINAESEHMEALDALIEKLDI